MFWYSREVKNVFLALLCATAFTGCLDGLFDEDSPFSYSVDDLVGTWSTTTTWDPDGDPLTEGVESRGVMAFSYMNGSVELTSLLGPNDEELLNELNTTVHWELFQGGLVSLELEREFDLFGDLVIATNVYQGWLDLTKQNMLGDATHDSERNSIPEDSYTGIFQAHK